MRLIMTSPFHNKSRQVYPSIFRIDLNTGDILVNFKRLPRMCPTVHCSCGGELVQRSVGPYNWYRYKDLLTDDKAAPNVKK